MRKLLKRLLRPIILEILKDEEPKGDGVQCRTLLELKIFGFLTREYHNLKPVASPESNREMNSNGNKENKYYH